MSGFDPLSDPLRGSPLSPMSGVPVSGMGIPHLPAGAEPATFGELLDSAALDRAAIDRAVDDRTAGRPAHANTPMGGIPTIGESARTGELLSGPSVSGLATGPIPVVSAAGSGDLPPGTPAGPGRTDWDDDPLNPPTASLVRPYARTGGRTKPVHTFDIEALVTVTDKGRAAAGHHSLSPEHSSVIAMCGSSTTSVAEVSVHLSVPLGVARVILADMVDGGLVKVMGTSATEGDERDPNFLRRVLSGLQRL